MREMKIIHRAALTACSDAEPEKLRPIHDKLVLTLNAKNIKTQLSPYLLTRDGSGFFASPREKARVLMDFYRDEGIDAIFDLSGGNLANELLDELDYELIARADKEFWGYSDLTVILNAIYARTGRTGVLYQVKNLVGRCGESQQRDFFASVREGTGDLFALEAKLLRGREMEGTVVGGNIRCFLKLAGTRYFPDLTGKLLLLESNSGTPALIASYLAQLQQLGAFERIAGLLLGTFTQLDREGLRPTAEELFLSRTPESLPVAKTWLVGHGADARAVRIGGYYHII